VTQSKQPGKERRPRGNADGMGRSYHQYCPVATGLDVIGERWTLLIVRDLLTGPKRYTDLLAGLPGIGTNLLATRVRELEDRNIVRRKVLPPPAASTVYELTEIGQELEPVVMGIGGWGARFMGEPREGAFLSANAYVLAMRGLLRPEVADGLNKTFELRVGHQVFEVRIAGGRCTTREVQPASPDATLSMDVLTLGDLLGGRLSAADAARTGRVNVSGDPDALETIVNVFDKI
jgi:DNA-binding HxlR family transcriptional regulator